jgi:transcription factor TGA
MQSFKAVPANPQLYCHSNFFLRGDGSGRDQTRFTDLGELEQSAAGFHHDDAVDLSPSILFILYYLSSIFNIKPVGIAVVPNNLHYGNFNTSIGCVDTGQQFSIGAALGNGQHIENWGESAMAADTSQQTDTSTDVDTDDKNQFHGVQNGALVAVDSKAKAGDQKTLRRLAQNREAAKKSRLRKKAYVQQLETSRLRLAQIEQDLQRARQQGIFISTGFSGDHSHSMPGSAALAFDMDYARWLDEHQRLINDLRSAVNSHMGDNELRLLVEGVMAHYDEIFRLKSIGARSDVFHMLSGMWKTPAERCFMWLGGFRSSELLKILGNHLEPLTDQQLMGIYNLQQSSQQAEDALSQGMEALQQSLVETLSSTSLGPTGSGNVADYMGQMAIAMGKLATLENFLHQADLLRQQTLQQMHRILTTRQAARALLVISDYTSRLRALSSLWLARPRD